MAAFVIADIDIADPVGYEEYRKLGKPTVPAYGGKLLVSGARLKNLKALGALSV